MGPLCRCLGRVAGGDDCSALELVVGPAGVHDAGGWSPLPSGLDLHAPVGRPMRWAAEVKVWDIDQQLWDALKLAAGLAHGDLRIGFLLAAACPTAFAHTGGRELFAAAASDHTVKGLLQLNAREWRHLLANGTGRPTAVPARITTRLLADCWCWFGHRVRLVRIAIDAHVGSLAFGDGWPVGVDGDAAVRAASGLKARSERDVLGLSVPAHWTEAWWQAALAAGATAEQFEALHGLLLTRGWTDTDIQARVQAPDDAAPAWWA